MQKKIIIDDINSLAFKNLLQQINVEENNIIIVPDKFSLNAELLFFEVNNLNVNFNTRVFSLTKLATEVLKQNLIDKKIVDKNQCILILSSIIKQNLTKFKYFKNIKDINAFTEDIFNSLSQLLSSNFNKSKKLEGALKDKFDDINLIFDLYVKRRQTEFIDSSYKYDLFLNEIKNSNLIKDNHFYFGMFNSFTPQTKKIVREIVKFCKSCSFSCSYSKNKINNNEIFNFYKGLDASIKVFENHSLTNYNKFIIEHLFSTNKIKMDTNDISVFEAKTIEEEIENLCVEIKKDILLNELRFKDICVCASNLNVYKEKIQEKFTSMNFNYFMDTTKNLNEFSFIQFILTLLKLINNFKIENFISLLSYNFIDVEEKVVSEFKSFIYKYNILKLDELEKYEILNGDEFFTNFKLIYSEVINKIYEIKQQNFKNVYEFFKSFETLLINFNSFNLLEDKIEEYRNKDIIKFKEYSQIKEKYETVIQNLIEFYDEDFNLNKICYYFNSCASNINVSLASTSVDSIFVGDSINSYFKDYKKIYIVGADSKNFPIQNKNNGLLTDEELRQIEIEEISPKIEEINKLNFYKCFEVLLLSSQNVVLSYSISSDDGEKLFPSIITKNLLNKFNIKIKKVDKESLNFVSNNEILQNLAFKIKNLDELKREFYKSVGKTKNIINEVLLHNNINLNLTQDKEQIDDKVLKDLTFSSSGLENYFSCGYKYFYKQILRLNNLEPLTINAKVIGNIVHNCCYLLGKKLICGEEISEKDKNKIINFVLNKSEYNFLKLSNSSNIILENLKIEINKLFDYIILQQKNSEFNISKVEYAFSENIGGINFTGIIDRVDETENEFILIDYKTGNTYIDFLDIILNKKIQLILYAKILEKILNKKCAGIFYLTINDDFSTSGVKSINFNGIVLNDGSLQKLGKDLSLFNIDKKYILNLEQFNKLKEYTFNNICSSVKNIKNGEIIENPIRSNNNLTCDYCEFSAICLKKLIREIDVDNDILKEILDD